MTAAFAIAADANAGSRRFLMASPLPDSNQSGWLSRGAPQVRLAWGCGCYANIQTDDQSTHSPPTHRHPSWYSPLRSQKRSNASSRASNTARLRARARSNHRPQKSRNKRRKRSRKVAPISVYSITADSLPLPINDPALNEE